MIPPLFVENNYYSLLIGGFLHGFTFSSGSWRDMGPYLGPKVKLTSALRDIPRLGVRPGRLGVD